eukprot:GSA25T00010162001.1
MIVSHVNQFLEDGDCSALIEEHKLQYSSSQQQQPQPTSVMAIQKIHTRIAGDRGPPIANAISVVDQPPPVAVSSSDAASNSTSVPDLSSIVEEAALQTFAPTRFCVLRAIVKQNAQRRNTQFQRMR